MAGSQATAGLRGGAVRDSGQHTSSELTWLGLASARRPGPQQGEGGNSPRIPGHDDEAALWSRGRRLGPACCRGGRATRRRLQQVRLLFRGGDLTTDGSGLGVSVPGSGCSGFAAATHRRTTRRTCSFGLLHERLPDSGASATMAWTAPAPSSPPFSFYLHLHERRHVGSSTTSQARHHSGPRLLPCLLRLLPSSNSFSPF
jgi:hypothetical protein